MCFDLFICVCFDLFWRWTCVFLWVSVYFVVIGGFVRLLVCDGVDCVVLMLVWYLGICSDFVYLWCLFAYCSLWFALRWCCGCLFVVFMMVLIMWILCWFIWLGFLIVLLIDLVLFGGFRVMVFWLFVCFCVWFICLFLACLLVCVCDFVWFVLFVGLTKWCNSVVSCGNYFVVCFSCGLIDLLFIVVFVVLILVVLIFTGVFEVDLVLLCFWLISVVIVFLWFAVCCLFEWLVGLLFVWFVCCLFLIFGVVWLLVCFCWLLVCLIVNVWCSLIVLVLCVLFCFDLALYYSCRV